MKNNQGVVSCGACVGKPSYLFLLRYIEFCINMQRGANPQPTPYIDIYEPSGSFFNNIIPR